MNSSSSNIFNVVLDIKYSNTIPQLYATSVNTTSSGNTVQFSYHVPRCRVCKHGHSQTANPPGCYDIEGLTITFVACNCTEHVPEDNLEYLEYLLKKKESL